MRASGWRSSWRPAASASAAILAAAGAFGAGAAAQGLDVPVAGGAGYGAGLPASAGELLDAGSRTYTPGIRAGSFVFLPSVSAAASYDNNVFATPAREQGDWYFRVAPELQVVSNWPRHALALHGGGSGLFYDEFTSETRGDAHAGASGVLDIQRDLWVRAYANYVFSHEPRGTGESFQDFEDPISKQTFDGGVMVHKTFNRLWLELGGQAQHGNYADARLATPAGTVIIDQDFRDGSVYEFFGRTGYEYSIKTSFFIEAAYNERDYQGASFDSRGYRTSGGVRYEFTRLLRGEASVGYLHQDTENGRESIDTISYRIQLLWEPTPLMSVALLGSRNVDTPSEFAGGSNRLVSEIGARVDYALWRNLILTGGLAYNWVDYVDAGRNDSSVRLLAGAEYQIGPAVSLFATDNYTDYGSDAVPNVDYSKNVVMMGVRARY